MESYSMWPLWLVSFIIMIYTTVCLSNYHFWDLLSFWNLWVEVFHPFWNILGDCFFKYYFCLNLSLSSPQGLELELCYSSWLGSLIFYIPFCSFNSFPLYALVCIFLFLQLHYSFSHSWIFMMRLPSGCANEPKTLLLSLFCLVDSYSSSRLHVLRNDFSGLQDEARMFHILYAPHAFPSGNSPKVSFFLTAELFVCLLLLIPSSTLQGSCLLFV